MKTTKQILYVAVGAGDFAAEKLRELAKSDYIVQIRAMYSPSQAKQTFEKNGSIVFDRLVDGYTELSERGRKTVERVRRSSATQKAVEQAKVARAQSKGAVTSAKKAAETSLQASKKAAETALNGSNKPAAVI